MLYLNQGFRVRGLGFRVRDLGCRVRGVSLGVAKFVRGALVDGIAIYVQLAHDFVRAGSAGSGKPKKLPKL